MSRFATKQQLLNYLAQSAIKADIATLSPGDVIRRHERLRTRRETQLLETSKSQYARNTNGQLHASASDSRLRACAAYVDKLATECAARYNGDFMHTRLRAAIADLANIANVRTVSNIPHTMVDMCTADARAQCAIVCKAFARIPDICTWLQADRAIAQLAYSSDSVADRLNPVRLLNPDAQPCEPLPFVVRFAPADSISATHGGSAVAKNSPGDCPDSYTSSSEQQQKREARAKRRLSRLLETSSNARNIVRLIGTMR